MAAASLDFATRIAELTTGFVGREWLFRAVEQFLAQTADHYLVITGEAGIGKSAVAARLTQRRTIHAHHFCVAREGGTLDPLAFVRSMSAQLAHSLPDFAQHVVQQERVAINADQRIGTNVGTAYNVYVERFITQARDADEAFQYLLRDPLRDWAAQHPAQPVVLLVDALDEAKRLQRSDNIVGLIDRARDLPSCVYWLLTSRPDDEVATLPGARRVILDDSRDNMNDIELFVDALLAEPAVARAVADAAAYRAELVQRSGGNFLYLRYVRQDLRAAAQAGRALSAPGELPRG
ncbi:MAG: ATP-binding protein, partial [Chloroflexota bacterium]